MRQFLFIIMYTNKKINRAAEISYKTKKRVPQPKPQHRICEYSECVTEPYAVRRKILFFTRNVKVSFDGSCRLSEDNVQLAICTVFQFF